MRKLFFTYILLCADDKFYVGVTNNLMARIMEHNSDDFPNSFCHKRRPVELVFTKLFFEPESAIAYEKQLKGWSKAKKWALIHGDFQRLHELAKCRNQSSHLNYMKPPSPDS
jgi:putative endonuclease